MTTNELNKTKNYKELIKVLKQFNVNYVTNIYELISPDECNSEWEAYEVYSDYRTDFEYFLLDNIVVKDYIPNELLVIVDDFDVEETYTKKDIKENEQNNS